jgi:hypothetical protein
MCSQGHSYSTRRSRAEHPGKPEAQSKGAPEMPNDVPRVRWPLRQRRQVPCPLSPPSRRQNSIPPHALCRVLARNDNAPANGTPVCRSGGALPSIAYPRRAMPSNSKNPPARQSSSPRSDRACLGGERFVTRQPTAGNSAPTELARWSKGSSRRCHGASSDLKVGAAPESPAVYRDKLGGGQLNLARNFWLRICAPPRQARWERRSPSI